MARKHFPRAFSGKALAALVPALVLLVCITLAVRAKPSPPAPHSDFLPALWVVTADRIAKIAAADGKTLLEITDVRAPQAAAIDDVQGLVWVFGDGQLHAYGFNGELRLRVPVPSPPQADTDEAETRDAPPGDEAEAGPRVALAVNPVNGSVWLALDKDLHHFDRHGEVLESLALPHPVRRVVVDHATERLGVATKHAVIALGDESTPTDIVGDQDAAPPVHDIAIDPDLQYLWVAVEHQLRRYDLTDGALLASRTVNELQQVASDGHGGVWLATDRQLHRLDAGEQVTVQLHPFEQKDGPIIALAADPRDRTVWVSTKKTVKHLDAQGQVLLTTPVKISPVRDLLLYRDTIPPELQFTLSHAGALGTTAPPAITLRYSDIGVGVDPSTLVITADNAALSVRCTFSTETASCAPTQPFPHGAIPLTATVQDFAGNMSEPAKVTVTPAMHQAATPAAGTVDPLGVCRVEEGGTTTLVYAFHNSSSANVEIEISDRNMFDDAADRGQPRWFPAGKGAFKTPLQGESDLWQLGTGEMRGDATTALCVLERAGGLTQLVLNGERIPLGIDAGGVAATAIQDTTKWPAIDRSKGEFAAGGTAGAFSVSHDGAAVYTIPILLPRGRGGFVPRELVLAYNSNAGNGMAGVGFQLAGISQIQRCTRHPTFGDADIAPIAWNDTAFCLDGKRLIADGPSQFRLEDDPAYRIKITRGAEGAPEVFEVEDGAGNTLMYGESDNSRVEDYILEHVKVDPRKPPPQPEVNRSADRVRFAWSLSTVRNRFGQTATFTYAREFREDNQRREWGVAQRLTHIAYDGFTVKFNYEARLDTWERYLRGLRLFTNGRLGEIRILLGTEEGTLIRRYVLDYEEAPTTKRSRLTSVMECDGRGACKAPLVFAWQDSDDYPIDWTFRPTERHIRLDEAFFNRVTALAVQVADLNNDGRDDLFLRTREQVAANSRLFFAYALSDGQGFSDDQLVPTDLFAGDQLVDVKHSLSFSVGGIPVWEPVYSRERVSLKSEMLVTDLNADGNPEFGVRTENGAGPYQFFAWQGGGSFTPVGLPFNRLMPYVGDINGDGLPELVTKHDNPNEWRFLVNSPSQPGSFHHQFSLPESSHPDLSGALVMETNGDAQYEFLIKRKPDLADLYFAAVNALPGDVATGTPRISESFLPLTGDPRVYFDANGDGVSDLVEMPRFECGPSWGTGVTPRFRQGTGAGSRRFSLWGRYPEGSQWQFGESIAPSGSNLDIANCVFRGTVDAIDNGVRAADIDGDGRQELLVLGERLLCQRRLDRRCLVGGVTPRQPFVARLKYDGSWETDSVLTRALAGLAFSPSLISEDPTGRVEHFFGYKLTRILDIDGDGIPEILHPRMLGEPSLTNHSIVLQVYKRESKKADLLASVTDSLGAKTEVTYAPMSDRSVFEPATENGIGICSYPLHCPRRGRWLVKDVTRSTGVASAPTRREGHRYSGARVDLSGRDWLGFAQHVVTDEARNSETTYVFNNITRQGRFYPFAGLVERQHTAYLSDPERTVAVENFTVYQNFAASNDRVLVRPVNACEARYDAPRPNPPPPRAPRLLPFSEVCTAYADYDAYGFAQNTTRTGGLETLKRTTTFAHRADQSPRMLGIVTDVRETSTVDGVSEVRTVAIVPDDKGLPQTQTIEPAAADASLMLVTAFVRDDVGLPLEITTTGDDPVTGPQTRKTITQYDSRGYPQVVINSEGHREEFVYHHGLGVPLARRDANGVLTQFAYDGFGRPVSTIHPAGADTFVTYAAGPDMPFVVTTTQKEGETMLESTTVQHDLLGRPTHRQTTAPRARTVHVWTRYDALGRAVAVSAPQFDADEMTAQFGVVQYDALDRVLTRTDPDGTVAATVAYDQLTRTVTNARGKKQVVHRDALGAVLRTQTQNEAGAIRGEVTFGYGPFGVLVSAAKQLSGSALTTTMTYDRLGRRRSLADPDRGTTQWTYNAFGEAVTETAADGQVETRVHDRLGRRLSTSSNEQGLPTEFLYDASPGGVGALSRARSSDGVETTHAYDLFGRPSRETVNVFFVGIFIIERSYDAAGRLSGIRYPEVDVGKRFEVSYDYSASAGAVLWRVKDGTGQTLWQAENHSPFGVLAREAFGNGLRTVRHIEATTGLLRGLESGFVHEPFVEETDAEPPPGLPDVPRWQGFGFDYDPARNIKSSVEVGLDPGGIPVNVQEEFGYDDLNRLDAWKVTSSSGTVNYAYRFDGHGNLELRVPDAGAADWRFEYGGPRPHAIMKSIVGGVSRSYDYDGRGRRHKDGENTITYTRFDLPKLITRGGAGAAAIAQFRYDAFGRRVRKFSKEIETLTIGGLYERVSPGPAGGTMHRFHVEGPGRVVAEVEWVKRGADVRQEVRYLHGDRQGSVEVVTGGATGQVLGRQRFEPYGNMVDPANLAVARVRPLVAGLRRGFTGHEHDEELGFVDMRGRVYDPRSASFLSPDPVVTQPQVAHSFHPYAYVTHNPANFTDPTGFLRQASSGVLDHQDTAGTAEDTGEDSLMVADFPGEPGSLAELDQAIAPPFILNVSVSIGISVSPASLTSDDNGSLRQPAPAKNTVVHKRSKTKAGKGTPSGTDKGHSPGCTAGQEGCDAGENMVYVPGIGNVEAWRVLAQADSKGGDIWINQRGERCIGSYCTTAQGGIYNVGQFGDLRFKDTSAVYQVLGEIALLPVGGLAGKTAGTATRGTAELAAGVQAAKQLAPKVRLTQKGLEHIVERHWATSGAKGAGKFAEGTGVADLRAMIDRTVWQGTSRANTMGRPGTIFEYNFGWQIGIDINRNAASNLRVVVSPRGEVITAFPF
jgi:RHS repeat-associated protein